MKKLFLIIIFISSTISVFAQKAVITLADETTIDGEQILLGEIAQISANEENSKKLREISLGFSPNIGMKRELFRNTILLALAAAGFSQADFSLNSPQKISVRRDSQIVEPQLMREAVEKAVSASFQRENVEVKISKLQFPEKILLPKGNVEVVAAPMSGVRSFLAPFTILLEIKVDGKTRHRTSANIEIETFAEVLVMNKALETNERITESDVKKEKIRLEKTFASYLTDTGKLRGKKLLKTVSADEPLLATSIIADSVIKTGDAVKIVGQAKRMQIVVLGEARAAGRIGDRIPVKNKESGIILQATVVEEGLVKVTF